MRDEPIRPLKDLDKHVCGLSDRNECGLDHDRVKRGDASLDKHVCETDDGSNTSVIELNEIEDEKDVIHGGDEVERIGAQNEGQFVKRMLDLRLPSKQEVEDHNLIHLL